MRQRVGAQSGGPKFAEAALTSVNCMYRHSVMLSSPRCGQIWPNPEGCRLTKFHLVLPELLTVARQA